MDISNSFLNMFFLTITIRSLKKLNFFLVLLRLKTSLAKVEESERKIEDSKWSLLERLIHSPVAKRKRPNAC